MCYTASNYFFGRHLLASDNIPHLSSTLSLFIDAKEFIVKQWIAYPPLHEILLRHGIEAETFKELFAGTVFDYFLDVIRGEQAIGDCPIMATFLNFLKDRDVTSDELFIICSHLRKAMIDFTYTKEIENRELLEEINSLFDLNFAGVLKMYSDRIYQKELELEESVKLLNEYKRAIDESALVSKLDLEGVLTYVNDNLVEACGFSEDELLGRTHSVIRHSDMPESFFKEMWKTIQQKKVFKGTIKNRKKTGDYFYVDATVIPITDAQENITEYITISYEVTRLVDARQEAVDAGEAKEYFLSNMSHEIRTPLNAILGFVSILLDEHPTFRQKKYLYIIQKSGENLLSIINDILDFSKLRSGEFTIETRPFILHEELSQTLELFAAPANEKDITLLSFIDPKIPYELIADPLRIKQIISNLLSNAIKFTPFGGKVEMEVTCPQRGKLVISVKDNGIGISSEDQNKIFNAFAQTQNSSTYLYGGTGLGLAICMKLAEHMGGSLGVASEDGMGSTFTLTLPVKANADGCSIDMFNPEAFKTLRVGLLQLGENESQKISLLRRYWDVFSISVKVIHTPEACECDLIFFVDSEIDDLLRHQLIHQKLPAIAIMDYLKETYNDVSHIAALYFPIYCAKLYNAFIEVMQLSSGGEKSIEKSQTQRQFSARVLVAEDNVANQELIKIILHRYGIEHVVAPDGLEALSLYRRERFDMILMDEQMPRMNGIEATKQIIIYEEEHKIAHTPIVALTANVIKGAKERGLSAGYDAFLGKPIVIKELEKVFEQFLEESSERRIVLCEDEQDQSRIHGVDEAKLLKELMLEPEQLLMLMKVFLAKMDTTLPQLEQAVAEGDFKEMARQAHSIKGSSANFRIKIVQDLAKKIEEAAISSDESCDYRKLFEELTEELKNIYIKDQSSI